MAFQVLTSELVKPKVRKIVTRQEPPHPYFSPGMADMQVRTTDPFAREAGQREGRCGQFVDVDVTWFGERHWPIRATWECLRDIKGDLLPFRLIEIDDRDPVTNTVLVVRSDIGPVRIGWLKAKYFALRTARHAKWQAFRALDLVGLLHAPPHRYATWRDIGFRKRP